MTTILRIARADRAVEVVDEGESFRLRVVHHRGPSDERKGLTAEQTLRGLADALRKPKRSGR